MRSCVATVGEHLERIRQQLRPGNQAPREEVVEPLNRSVRGWAADFNYGSASKARSTVQR